MPELVKDHLTFSDSLATEEDQFSSPSKERYLVMALTSLLAINLVVIFGALTFYYLLIRR